MTRPAVAPWWTTAFRRRYLDVYAHRDDASAERECAFLASLLAISLDARLLDLGCGAGRHARAFADRGADATGVDLSPELLAEARARGGARYALADFRRLPFRSGAFAHVVSLFTSFGYFDEDGDRAQLAEVRRVLVRGGTFVLDFLNAPQVTANLVAESERSVGGSLVRELRHIRSGRVEKELECEGERWTESVRLYGRDELTRLLAAAHLRVTSAYGDLAGAEWNEAAPRLVLVAVAG